MYFSFTRSVFVRWMWHVFAEQSCRKTGDWMYVCYNLNTFTGTLMFAYPSSLFDYAPNFEEVDMAYWFLVVRASVCPSVHQEPCMLGFWNFIYGFLMETCFFFPCLSYLPFWNFAPLKKSEWNLMLAISYEPCMLGFWNFIYGSSWKNSWPIFFSCPSSLPFWSHAPLKKSEWNLVSKISRKVFELGAWNLVSW